MRLGLGLTSAVALPIIGACSSQPARVCGLGCAGDADVFAARLGAPLRYERIYHRTESFPGPLEAAAWAGGRIPVVSFKTLDAAGQPIPFASVAAGGADAQLDALARSLEVGLVGDIVLIYFHEPEEEAGAERADFAAAFRRVRARIERGLSRAVRDRIRWAMCLTYAYYGDGSANEFYPGDDVVDVLAVDGYNWCPGSGHGSNATSFRELFADAEGFARDHDKTWLVTEVGTWDDPAPGQSKADWIGEAVPVVEEWSSLEAVLWFEHDAGFRCDWSIGDDADALAAFRRLGERMCQHE
jgi:hypothetical protein